MSITFSEYAEQLSGPQKIDDNKSSEELKQSASNMADAARHLSVTSNNQLGTMSGLTQAIGMQQIQIQQTNAAVSRLVQIMTMQSPVSSYAPPPPMAHYGGGMHMPHAPIGQYGRMGATAVGGMAFNYAQNFMSGVSNLNAGYATGTPLLGDVHVSGSGSMSSNFLSATGLNYNQANSRSYTHGAYLRSARRDLADSANDAVVGGIAGGIKMGMSTMKAAALTAAFPMAGGAASFFGLQDYIPDPITGTMDDIDRATVFGASANKNAFNFLRGRQGGDTGRFNIQEEADIGKNLRRMTLNDLTYGTSEVSDLQMQFSDAGLMSGVKSAESYTKKFKSLLESHKVIAKTLQLSNEEAVEFMKGMEIDIGMSATRSVGSVFALNHLSGLSPMEVMDRMKRGGAGAASMGLHASTGAMSSAASMGFAGSVFSRGTISQQQMGSIGGEQGLVSAYDKLQSGFLSGIGGTMMGMGGDGTVDSGFGAIHSGIKGGGDLIDFLANRNQRIDDKMQETGGFGSQVQSATLLYDMAKKLSPNAKGKQLRDVMILLAKQKGLNINEAQAVVDSLPTLKSSMSDNMRLRNQAHSDMMQDVAYEQNSFTNRIRRGYRQGLDGAMGGFVDGIIDAGSYTGQLVDTQMEHAQDFFYGIKRSHYSQDEVDAATLTNKNGKLIEDLTGNLSRGTSSLSKEQRENMRRLTRGGTRAGKLAREIFSEDDGTMFSTSSLYSESDRDESMRRKYLMQAMLEGKTISMRGGDANLGINQGSTLGDYINNNKLTISDDQYRQGLRSLRRSGVVDKDAYDQELDRMTKGEADSSLMTQSEMIDMIETYVGESLAEMPGHKLVSAFRDRDYQKIIKLVKELEDVVVKHGESSVQAERVMTQIERRRAAIEEKGNPELNQLVKQTLETVNLKFNIDGKLDVSKFTDAKSIRDGKPKIASRKGILNITDRQMEQDMSRLSKSRQRQAQLEFAKTGLGAIGLRGFVDESRGVDVDALGAEFMSLTPDDFKDSIANDKLRKDMMARQQEFRNSGMSNYEIGNSLKQEAIKRGANSGENISVEGLEGSQVLGVNELKKISDYIDKNTDVLERMYKELESK